MLIYVHYSDTLQPTTSKESACRIICTVTPENGGSREHCTLSPFESGATVAEVPFHNSILGNFMVYQDRLEINLLQPFGHTHISE